MTLTQVSPVWRWGRERKGKQLTRGHNIVADGWAGAFNPHPHPNPLPTLKHTQKVSKTLVFPRFNSMTPDGRTDRPTDGRTDKASYRVECPQLKRKIKKIVTGMRNIEN